MSTTKEENDVKKSTLIKVILVTILLLVFAYYIEEYTVLETLLAVCFFFGIYMIIVSLFVQREIKYRAIRIITGAVLIMLTIYYCHAVNDISDGINTLLLAFGGIFFWFILPVAFMVYIFFFA